MFFNPHSSPELHPEMKRRVDWILAEIVFLQQLIILCVKVFHVSSLANLGNSSPTYLFFSSF